MILPLHHAGYLVADLPAAAEEWASRFGYVIESQVIEDMTQTALVQFLRQPGAPCWLELVSPNGPGSKLSAALREGGMHHFCYEAADMGEACRHLRCRGMFPLSRPVPATAFGGRRIAWFIDRAGLLIELVEAGDGPLSLASIASGHRAGPEADGASWRESGGHAEGT